MQWHKDRDPIVINLEKVIAILIQIFVLELIIIRTRAEFKFLGSTRAVVINVFENHLLMAKSHID